MNNIDKQAVQAVADLKAGYTLGHADVAILNELARIALASLEAEAVCVIDQSNLDYLKSGADADVWPASRKEMGDVLLYRTAPPAPAKAEPVAWLWSHRKHPSEVSLVRPEDDERAEGAHWSGWSCQALYAAPPAPVSMKDHQIRELVNELRDIAVEYHGTQQLRERIARTIRAAMLQGAEPVTAAYKLPDGCCVMPLKLTAENGAKGALSGEFHVTNRIVCQSCAGEGCEDCNDEGGWDAEIPVSWDTIKRIHEAAVEACSLPAAPQQEAE
ncbi:hypothetical protein [Enterobacter kobei]|uniref:hypothetical protein n=1 Tax=Enterobacter kobei TaxID=208224 RepID=UPI00207615BF|nr:hypothetical protein [Enterobacter kobei]MCM7555409.1 hypothetical protein [Enterobacter kobei]